MWTYLLILYFAPFLFFSYLMLFLDFMCWNDYFITFYDFLHHQVMGRTRGSRGLTPQVPKNMTKKPKYNIILASTVFLLTQERENVNNTCVKDSVVAKVSVESISDPDSVILIATTTTAILILNLHHDYRTSVLPQIWHHHR